MPATHGLEAAVQWFLGITASDTPREACPDALDIASSLVDPATKAFLLAQLAARLPEPFHGKALADLWNTGDVPTWAGSLAVHLRELADPLQSAATEALLATLPREDNNATAFTLSYLALVLPDDLKPTAIDLASAINDPLIRAQAFADLAGPWSGEWRERAIEAALQALRSVSDDTARFVTLAQFLEQWTPAVPDGRSLEAFVRETIDPFWRLCTLAVILPFLDKERVQPLIDQACQEVERIPTAKGRAQCLTALLPHLMGETRANVLEIAWREAGSISDPNDYLWHLRDLFRACNSENGEAIRSRAVAEARKTLSLLDDLRQRAFWLNWLAEDLPELRAGLHREALQTALSIESHALRAGTLSDLALHLAEPLRQAAFRHCLEAAQAAHDDWTTLRVIRTVAGLAAPDMMTDLVVLARTISNSKLKAEALVTLAARFPADRGERVLEVIRAMGDNRLLANTLVAFAANVADERKATLLREALHLTAKLPPGEESEPSRSQLLDMTLREWRRAGFAGAARADATQYLRAVGQEPLPDTIQDFHEFLPLADQLADTQLLAPTVRTLRDVLTWWLPPGTLVDSDSDSDSGVDGTELTGNEVN